MEQITDEMKARAKDRRVRNHGSQQSYDECCATEASAFEKPLSWKLNNPASITNIRLDVEYGKC